MATNLRAPVIITNLAVSHLLKTKGNIINISSIAAVLTLPNYFAYCTSKAGLDHFTRSIALELAPKGVRVNTVNPDPVLTDIIQNAGGTEDHVKHFIEISKKFTPLQRISKSEEVADLILFLASDKAIAITGSACFTDNGARVTRGNMRP